MDGEVLLEALSATQRSPEVTDVPEGALLGLAVVAAPQLPLAGPRHASMVGGQEAARAVAATTVDAILAPYSLFL